MNKGKLSLLDLEIVLNNFEQINYDNCVDASLHGRFKDVWYYKGFEACICCLKDFYGIKKDVDILNQIRYF